MTMSALLKASIKVAPFAGAWIEIRVGCSAPVSRVVAPFAGAWIEIFAQLLRLIGGLVAPFAGAWIEILEQIDIEQVKASLPSRERGLKYKLVILVNAGLLSLPSRERGLKCMP